MNLTIYNDKGLSVRQYKSVNRVVYGDDKSIRVYYDWDGISFARDDIEANEYEWFELGDR